MNLLAAMLPFYLMGNLHCMGMCGPLAMTLGAHRYRYFYFVGRLCAFTLAGTAAGGLGAVLNVYLSGLHLSAIASLLLGVVLIFFGALRLAGRAFPGQFYFAKMLSKANGRLSLLILRDMPLATFLFGFLTIALPCGQSLVVFSACALSGSLSIGALNGFAFALLTSPALWLAMKAQFFLNKAKKYYHLFNTLFFLLVGCAAVLRGLAELQYLPHLTIELPLEAAFHLVLY